MDGHTVVRCHSSSQVSQVCFSTLTCETRLPGCPSASASCKFIIADPPRVRVATQGRYSGPAAGQQCAAHMLEWWPEVVHHAGCVHRLRRLCQSLRDTLAAGKIAGAEVTHRLLQQASTCKEACCGCGSAQQQQCGSYFRSVSLCGMQALAGLPSVCGRMAPEGP